MSQAFRRKIISSFRLQGLSLKGESTNLLVEVLGQYAERKDLDNILDRIIEAVQKQSLASSLIGKEVLEPALEECNEASDADTEAALVVINAFDVPKFVYNVDTKKYLSYPDKKTVCLFGQAGHKGSLFRERYMLLRQRTLRNEFFTPTPLGQTAQSEKYSLQSVEYLLSSSGITSKVIILGMVSQIKEGKYHLEDPTGNVELDISECEFHVGLFTENCLVLAEGVYNDKVFQLSAIGFPPIEEATESMAYFGSMNFFGGPSPTCAKSSIKLQAMMKENKDAMFVFMSDVHLDDQKVTEKLTTLFNGYADCPPTAFVMMGPFSSKPYGSHRVEEMKENFTNLGNLILGFPDIAKTSQFIFIPSSLDPGAANILPRPPISPLITRGVQDRIPGSHFCSNPARIQFCSREIVVFCEDLMSKLCRNCIRFPSNANNLPSLLTRTILSQAHLSPLPLHVRPIYWMYDHAHWLYPLPDLVVLGDKCDPFTETLNKCTVSNVGSFVKSGFEFKVYLPSTNAVEDSKIMDQ